MNAVTQLQANALLRRVLPMLPKVATVALVILLAKNLADLTWLAVAPTELIPLTTGAGGPQRVAGAPKRPQHADPIAGRHLFGEIAVAPAPAAAISAPETTLNLTLRGVFATGGKDGLALIASGPSNEDLYIIGARIPGGAVLHEVLPDRVILERNGQYETLKLPKESQGLAGFEENAALSPSPSLASPPGEPVASSLAQFRQEAMRNPGTLAEMVDIAPVQEGGSLQGYRITPKVDNPLFAQLGLQPGDVVTSINGVSLDRPENGMRVLRDLMRADEVNVTILRGGQSINLQQHIGR